MEKFIALWQHRYRKYSEIFLTYLAFWKTVLRIKWIKFRTGKPTVGILMTEHLGDIVACEPISQTIRERHPDAQIFWIVKKAFRDLVAYNPRINHLIEEPNVLFSILLTEKKPFDTLYNLHLSNRVYFPLQKRLVNPIADQRDLTIHNYLNFGRLGEIFAAAAGLPLPDRSKAPSLYIPDEVRSKIDALNLPEKFAVFHTFSNQPVKDWQPQHWNQLTSQVLSEFGPVIEVGLKGQIQSNSPSFRDLCGQLSILETAEVIRRASFFVGVDSGPAHLANAVGTYGFLLIGKLVHFEDFNLYTGGYGDGSNARIIWKRKGPASELTFEEVWQPLQEYLMGRRMTEFMAKRIV
ncbi:glycosyltransferase family 9 protein [Siphonobacter sp. SORGH_AS_0500]|uniref:glycosyltransferase family 9 protein n=1 Tax=Siphonobacter sp. SORGH_AS_0500 TaxID=1864824 RepID=UPI000CB90805|nr:glycosyltransferase family 9 protein [Siphonobacter sp. SORGH_AS_0500]MDR6194871.1 heptosyltransferase-3 [Siphonobacter sp. SORGH_AS_0500]PKK38539.1 hypothetical protein BWI96_01855 [Siphonobacter sp. SORGH_AS_0500]